MQMLTANAIPVVPLARIVEAPGAVALTFDDGFRNFREVAWPLLAKHRFPATVFVVSGYCGRRNDWPGQTAGLPRLDLMSWSELRELTAHGIQLGAHSVHHPDLTKLPEPEVAAELDSCRTAIEQEIGAAVDSFAYPYGAVNQAVRRIAGEQFIHSCGTRLEFVQSDSNPAELPRLDAYYLRRLVWFDHLMRPMGRGYLSVRSSLRRLRQCYP